MDKKFGNYDLLTKINWFTNWEDIKEGDVFYIPRLYLYERRRIKVLKKSDNYLEIETNENGKVEKTILSKFEVSTKFLVRKRDFVTS